MALIGGTIHTQTDAGVVKGTVLVRDGKVVAVGPAVKVPPDAERLDVTGLVVTPGLIDARSTLWLTPAAADEGSSNGKLNILDGVDPYADDWHEVIRQGVTAVYVQPSAEGLLGGRGAVLRVGPAGSVEDLTLKSDAGLQAALGTQTRSGSSAPTRPSPFPGFQPPTQSTSQPSSGSQNPLTRRRQYDQIKKALDGAKKYASDWQAYEKAKAEKKEGKEPKEPDRDATKEFLARVLKGEVPLRLEAHREDDIRNALDLADEFKLRIVLEGVSNPRTQTAELRKRRLPLVLGPVVESGSPPAYRRGRPSGYPKSVLPPDGTWALATFGTQPRVSRLLRVQAAAAVAGGASPEAVLRAITSNAAQILGVSDRVGTVEAGKQADLAVFAGDPLDPAVPVRLVLSRGQVVHRAPGGPVPGQPLVKQPEGLPEELPPKYVIQTSRLLHETGAFGPGKFLVEEGKIVAVGPDVAAGMDVPTFDLGSAVVTPGLVAAHTDLGLGSAIDEKAEADAGFLRSLDAFDPRGGEARQLLGGGFAAAGFAPGSANVVSGTVSGVRLGAREPVLAADSGVQFVLASGSRDNDRYPASLAGQVELLERSLTGTSPPFRLYLPELVRQQLEAERRRNLAAVREGKKVAFIQARTRAEVAAALRLIARHELRGILVGPTELAPFLPELTRLGKEGGPGHVGIIVRPVEADDYARQLDQLVQAASAGVAVAFGSGSAREMRTAAALAVNAGLPPETALRGLTSAAADLAGLPTGSGRLAPGAPADFVIWTGSPIDLQSRVLRVAVDGRFVPEGS